MNTINPLLNINSNFWEFIRTHKNDNPSVLSLSIKKERYDFDTDFALTQIDCRKRYCDKLNNFLEFDEFIFPDKISGEQSSHQAVAHYHSSLIEPDMNILDMTAGLGIDSMSLAQKAREITSIELNNLKSETLEYNAWLLGLKNINVIKTDSVAFLSQTDRFYDIIFIDPSRRDSDMKRVYNLKNCLPDVVNLQEILYKKGKRILIKASPLIDLTQTIKDFSYISSVYAIGVKGECKEILIELDKDSYHQNLERGTMPVFAVDLDKNGNIINSFSDIIHISGNTSPDEIKFATMEDIKEGNYLMEPSAMMMKLATWNTICKRYNAKKLGKSSHLFITEEEPVGFPGRVTRLEKILKKQDRKNLSGNPVNVVSRNHPLSAETIRSQLRLKEGESMFIYASKLGDKPIMLLSHLSKN